MEKINSITQAYSMQPDTYRICLKTEDYSNFSNKSTPHEHSEKCIKNIEAETLRISTDKESTFYVAYDFKDNKMFQFPMDAVSVEYLHNPQ